MPLYSSPTTPARYLQAGVPEYLFGSYNFKQSPTSIGERMELLTSASQPL